MSDLTKAVLAMLKDKDKAKDWAIRPDCVWVWIKVS